MCRDRADQFCELSASYGTKPGQKPLPPGLWGPGYSTTTAWSPISANRGRGRGRVPDSRQIGDGDGGASPPPGKSGTDAPSPSFENAFRTVRSAFQNLRLGAIKLRLHKRRIFEGLAMRCVCAFERVFYQRYPNTSTHTHQRYFKHTHATRCSTQFFV